MKLILASASPRRSEILRDAGISFEVVHTHADETPKRGETARAMTRRLAEAKARAALREFDKAGRKLDSMIVIGADTIVDLRGRLLGKPGTSRAARRTLAQLSGKTHRVVTSVAAIRVPGGAKRIFTQTTRVRFVPLSAGEISGYVATGEPLDKAGAYAVQGAGGRFIERIEGCYFNVVGLPLARLYRILIELGWRPTHGTSRAQSNAAR